MIEGWAQLNKSVVFHYCQLNQIAGCGIYRGLCGARGWITEIVEVKQASATCQHCVRLLGQVKPTSPFELVPCRELPPNQVKALKWPVIHLNDEPQYDEDFDVVFDGLVISPLRLTLTGITADDDLTADMHCVMRWSMRSLVWRGILMTKILRRIKPLAAYAIAYADNDYTTNLRVEDLRRGILATHVNGDLVPSKYGGPVRLVIPHLYAWKSPKWIRRLEFVNEDRPGTWEQRGLHMRGDPWKEERFAEKSA